MRRHRENIETTLILLYGKSILGSVYKVITYFIEHPVISVFESCCVRQYHLRKAALIFNVHSRNSISVKPINSSNVFSTVIIKLISSVCLLQ